MYRNLKTTQNTLNEICFIISWTLHRRKNPYDQKTQKRSKRKERYQKTRSWTRTWSQILKRDLKFLTEMRPARKNMCLIFWDRKNDVIVAWPLNHFFCVCWSANDWLMLFCYDSVRLFPTPKRCTLMYAEIAGSMTGSAKSRNDSINMDWRECAKTLHREGTDVLQHDDVDVWIC